MNSLTLSNIKQRKKNDIRNKKIGDFRKQYRIDLKKAREIYGDWVTFGYNLGLLKKD